MVASSLYADYREDEVLDLYNNNPSPEQKLMIAFLHKFYNIEKGIPIKINDLLSDPYIESSRKKEKESAAYYYKLSVISENASSVTYRCIDPASGSICEKIFKKA